MSEQLKDKLIGALTAARLHAPPDDPEPTGPGEPYPVPDPGEPYPVPDPRLD
jgi:hypothetical protein